MNADRYRDWTPDLIGDPERLKTLRRLGLLDTPPEESFDRLTRLVSRLLDVPVALVSLVDEDRQFFKAQFGLEGPWAALGESPLDRSFCKFTLGSSEPLVIEDARVDPLVRDNLGIGELGIVAYLGMPLTSDDGQTIGSLCAIDHRPRNWSDQQIEDLRELAHVAMREMGYAGNAIGASGDSRLPGSGRTGHADQVGSDASRQRFESVMNHSPDIIAIVNTDSSVQYISPSIERLLGIAPDDLKGELMTRLIHEEDLEALRATLAISRESGATLPRMRLRYRNDPSRVFDVVLTDLRDDPLIHGFVVSARDIIEPRVATSDEDSPEGRYRALVQHTSSITSIIGIDGMIRYDSPAATRILGYPLDELTGHNSLEFIHPDDVEAVVQALRAGMRPGSGKVTVQYRFRHADGTWRWLESIADNLLADPDVSGLVLTSRDVTEQRETEEALRQNYLTTLIRYGADLVFVLNRDQTIRYLSPSVETILGFSPAIGVGMQAADIVHKDDHERAEQALEPLLSGEQDVVRFEVRARHRTDGWRWLELAATYLIEEPGIDGIVVNARDITERKTLERQLAHDATHDALTGLPNRTLFLDRLRSAQDDRNLDADPIAVLFIDLDDFKLINDSHGHVAGDLGLQVVGQRIHDRLGRRDTMSRFGGDEFTVLVDRVRGIEDAGRVAADLLAAISQPFVLSGQETRIRASIGIAVSSGVLRDPHDLLRAADTALYRAKALGGGTWLPYTPAMAEEVRQRLTTELQLRHALEREELRVRYQPIVELATGRMVGVEALVRWKHPELGLLGPSAFLGIAQASGLIEPIGQWVLREACTQAARWSAVSPVWVSVNIASEQLRQPNFIGQIAEAIDQAGIQPSMLHVEITESITAREGMAYLDQLHELRRMGVGLAIDDFGTGESSLASLRRYPVDTVKIDRAFIAGADGDGEAAIVRAVLGVGRALGLAVIAEGVETEGERRLLQSLGCTNAQGYYFGRPMMSHRIMERLRDQVVPTLLIRAAPAD